MPDEHKPIKILIVEDDQYIASAYRAKFDREADFKVTAARDGAEALKAVDNDPPDLILLDLLMPNVDGFAVLKQLKDQAKHIPVIVASNLDDASQQARVKELGAADYYIKSDVSIAKLVELCRETARRGHA